MALTFERVCPGATARRAARRGGQGAHLAEAGISAPSKVPQPRPVLISSAQGWPGGVGRVHGGAGCGARYAPHLGRPWYWPRALEVCMYAVCMYEVCMYVCTYARAQTHTHTDAVRGVAGRICKRGAGCGGGWLREGAAYQARRTCCFLAVGLRSDPTEDHPRTELK